MGNVNNLLSKSSQLTEVTTAVAAKHQQTKAAFMAPVSSTQQDGPSQVPQVSHQEIAFFDPRVEALEQLLEGLRPGIIGIVLDENRPGLSQVYSVLARSQNIKAVHIISHGEPGRFQLGSGWIDASTLQQHSPMLSRWREFLAHGVDLLLYGCRVGAHAAGQSLIAALRQHLGVNVQASQTLVGQSALGGRWALDVTAGPATVALAFSDATRTAYPAVLASFLRTSFGVGSAPIAAISEDFDQDGNLDIAVANSLDNTVSVLLGNSTGGFGTQTTFAVGSSPRSVAAADFDGDGNIDLATANFNDDTVSLLLGDGTGGFGTQTAFTVGSIPQSLTAGDFDGDTLPDLAVTNLLDGTISILLANGTGGFAPESVVNVGDEPQFVTTGDFNQDGDLDLAAVTAFNTVSVLIGDGNGGFGTPSTFGVADAPEAIAVGDLNGDNIQDLAVANVGDDVVSVLLGDGTGSFGGQTTFATSDAPVSITLADLNQDSLLDIATTNLGDDTISVLLGTGGGNFAPQIPIAAGDTPQAIISGDFDQDGLIDLVTTDFNDDALSVLINSLPIITVATGQNALEAESVNGEFQLTLSAPAPAGGLVVSYGDAGSTADSPNDYTLLAGTNITNVTASTFTVAEGATTANLTVATVDDAIDEDAQETVILNLLSGSDYVVDSVSGSATVEIEDNDPGVEVLPSAVEETIEFSILNFTKAAQELSVQLEDGSFVTLITAIGDTDGLPEGLGHTFRAQVDVDALASDGKFRLRSLNTGEFTELTLQGTITDTTFTLSGDGFAVEAAIADTNQPSVTGRFNIGGDLLEGLKFDGLTAPTAGTATVQVEATLFREARFDNLVGFYLADKTTGDVIDPLTGSITGTFSGPATDYRQAVLDTALIQGQVDSHEMGGFSDNTFEFNTALTLSDYVLLPFLDAEGDSNLDTLYVTSLGINADNANHVQLLGQNIFGFEDIAGGGDNDFDDMVVEVKSITIA